MGRCRTFICTAIVLCSLAACHSDRGDQEENNQVSSIEISGSSPVRKSYDLAKLAKIREDFGVSEAPAAQEYRNKINSVLAAEQPVLRLPDQGDRRIREVQDILLADPNVIRTFRTAEDGLPTRNEVMSVRVSLPGDHINNAASCRTGECYRADIYNFFSNQTTSGIVDIVSKQVRVVSTTPETQPELSPALKELALSIAEFEPAVQLEINRYLEFAGQPGKEDLKPLMAGTKSALRDTLCERSRHLCVAPTYVLGDFALWVIVDLTDLKVAGLRWTKLGKSGPPTVVTERNLENEYVFKNYCQKTTSLERSGWKMDYHLTASDGLRVANVSFEQKPVFESSKVVDWHVAYSKKYTFGYSDATGCPMFSSAVVVAFDSPKVEAILDNDGMEIGFSLRQDFRQLPWPAVCNYRYEERYEFYHDGRFRIAMSNLGRGCGDYGTYRPVLRVNFGGGSTENPRMVDEWLDQNWQPVDQEKWIKQPAKELMWQQTYTHRIRDGENSGYLLAPSQGQFSKHERGDDAFVYFTAGHPDRDEGESDLVTLGACCNLDYQQGPELFMQPPEPMADAAKILWYVPRVPNDGRKGRKHCWADIVVEDGVKKIETYPCTAGPMFVPMD